MASKPFEMLMLLLIAAFALHTDAQDTVSVNLREQVTLSCPLDLRSCGRLHSVKWYRGQDGRNRVAVYSDDLKVKNTEGPQGERLSIIHTPGGDVTELRLAATQITDEDLYTCEGTFIAPEDNCESVTTIQLNILVAPTKVVLADENGDTLPHNSALGPMREGAQLLLFCEAFDGRPAPKITWRQGDRNLKGSDNIAEHDGVFTSRSELSLTLTREHLKAKIDCIVESPALKRMRTESVILDLQVRPTKISVTGVEHHVVQGTRVTLQCLVQGARPAANVTWYNSTRPVDENIITTNVEEKKDGTFETSSQMVFTGTRFENGQNFRCEADNVVIRDDIDKPIHDSILLDVRYPPVVKVRPLNITVNETSDILLFCEYESNPASLDQVVWLHDGKPVNISDSRYDGGSIEHQALQIKNSSRDDIGTYVCELTNNVGKGKSTHDIQVDVLYRPVVNVELTPASPLIEADNATVDLQCRVLAGNPDKLERVRWYLDGFILKELTSCNDTVTDEDALCVNPEVLQLVDVERTFHGNYSCSGFTAAGWGEVSPPAELLVYYAPGSASISLALPHEVPVKGQSVTLTCSLKDKGRPSTTRFRWMRGTQMISDVVTPSWTIDPVTLESRSNITCFGHNEGGDGEQATMFLDVLAPPAFIATLLPYSGALYNAPSFGLSCRVECYPACKIHWLRDGEHIESTDEKYAVTESRWPAHPAAGHFESVTSTLHWNMTAWPNNRLDPESDGGNYSCVSSRNEAGGPVSSTTLVAIEYPPQNVQLSETRISVIEGQIPARVLCSAKSQPEASYVWKRHDEVVAKGNSLILNTPVTRGGDGEYVCEATNKHGTATGITHLNVMFKPECVISQTEVDGSPALACTAISNPAEVDFSWQMKLDNETVPAWDATSRGIVSHLILDDSIESFRTYICVANNSVGVGVACERDVLVNADRVRSIAWWKRWDKETIIIVVAAVIGLVLAVLIVCILIIVVCRRKRQNEKYHSTINYEDRQSPEGYPDPGSTNVTSITDETLLSPASPNINDRSHQSLQPLTSPKSPQVTTVTPLVVPSSPPRWPLRPGVLVHVKRNFRADNAANIMAGDSNQSREETKEENNDGRDQNEKHPRDVKTARELNFGKRNGGMFSSFVHAIKWAPRKDDETENDENANDLPGLVRLENEVISFKKVQATNNRNSEKDTDTNRKRKKPGQAPDKSLAANAADEEDSPGIYENLPFHGLQSAPNKLTRPNKTILRVPPTLKYTPPYSATTPSSASTKSSSSVNLHNIPNGTTHSTSGYNLIPLSNFRPNPFLSRATRSQLYNARTLTTNHTFDPNEKKLTGSLPKNQKTRRKSHSFHSMRAKCASNRHKRTSVAICDDKQYDSADTYTTDQYNHPVRQDDERYHDHTYENLTDSIQIYESSNELPMPAPRCKSSNGSRSREQVTGARDDHPHHYANVAANVAGEEEEVVEPPPIPQLPSLELYSKPESIDDLLYDYKV